MRTSALLATLFLAACAEDKVVNMPLHLETLDCEPVLSQPALCGGTIVVELFEFVDEERRLVQRHCSSFAPDQALEGLFDLDRLVAADPPRFPRVKDGLVMARAAVFSPGVLGECPPLQDDPGFDVGVRKPVVQGESTVIRLGGSATSIDVPLQCVSEMPFECSNGDDPAPIVSRVSATFADLGTLVTQAEGLRTAWEHGQAFLDLGYVASFNADGTVASDGTNFFMALGELFYGGSSIWTTPILQDLFLPSLCTSVTILPNPPVVSCDSYFDGTDGYATGYVIDPTLRTNILRAVGLPASPQNGVIIGRVVDSHREPVEDAAITDPKTRFRVRMPRADFSGVTPDQRTDVDGWFVVDDPTFMGIGTDLRASTLDGREGFSPYIGPVEASITATVIELPEIPQTPTR